MQASRRKDDGQVLALMERVLGAQGALAGEYPTVFRTEGAGSFVTIEDEGRALAACAILPRELLCGPVKLRVGLIGSVVTDPEYRRRGLGTQLMTAAESALAADGALVALLWADDAGFYTRRGWREVGVERDFIVGPENLEALPLSTNVRRARAADAEAIHLHYLRHPQRVQRTLEETRELLNCPGMRVLLEEIGGVVHSYACLGRGRDLANVVHEWGGDPRSVLALLRAHLEHRMESGLEEALFVLTPGAHTALHGKLALAGIPSSVGVLGLAKVLDTLGLAQFCAGQLGARGLVRVRENEADQLEFTGPAGHAPLAKEELLDLALAARGERGVARDLAERLGVTSEVLPLKPFVWGLDSI